MSRSVACSATRFGKISLHLANFKTLRFFFKRFNLYLGKFNLFWQFFAIGHIFIVVHGQILKKIIWPSGHTSVLLVEPREVQ